MSGVDIKPIDYQKHKRIYRKMNKEQGEKIDIDFGESPRIMKDRYMDMYDEVYAEVVATHRFDENVDLSMTYLGRNNMQRERNVKGRREFSNLRTRICKRKVEEWQRVSNTFGYWSK